MRLRVHKHIRAHLHGPSKRSVLILLVSLLTSACIRQIPGKKGPTGEIRVAAAANLNGVLQELNTVFERNTGVHAVPSFSATAQLSAQIEAGAPFDVFLAADTEHVEDLIRKGFGEPSSRTIYATGQLAVYAPRRNDLRSLDSLVKPKPVEVFMAKPELAPYGAAAVEAMKSAGIWNQLQEHIKYAPNIAAAKQYADTGNCDASFTAYSLVFKQNNTFFVVDPKLYKPINQALCIVKKTANRDLAELYSSFLVSVDARPIWKNYGYGRH